MALLAQSTTRNPFKNLAYCVEVGALGNITLPPSTLNPARAQLTDDGSYTAEQLRTWTRGDSKWAPCPICAEKFASCTDLSVIGIGKFIETKGPISRDNKPAPNVCIPHFYEQCIEIKPKLLRFQRAHPEADHSRMNATYTPEEWREHLRAERRRSNM